MSKEVEQLKREISNRDSEIRDLKGHLTYVLSEKQSRSKESRELQKQLDKAQEELREVKKENEKMRKNIKEEERIENLAISHELKEQNLLKVKQELTEDLNKERLKNQELEKELSQLCSENKKLADELREQSSIGEKSLMEEMGETQIDTKHKNKASENKLINKPKQKTKNVATFLEHPLSLFAISSPRRV